MNPRRIARLQEQIKARIAEVLMKEIADPGLGLVTITRVEVDKEFTTCKAFWSVLGDVKERKKQEQLLRRATPFIQREVASVLRTRTVPRLSFWFDESIEGAARMQEKLNALREEREAREREKPAAEPETGGD